MKQSWRMERRVFLLHLWTLWSLKKNGFSWYCLVKHLRLVELFENIDQSETNVLVCIEIKDCAVMMKSAILKLGLVYWEVWCCVVMKQILFCVLMKWKFVLQWITIAATWIMKGEILERNRKAANVLTAYLIIYIFTAQWNLAKIVCADWNIRKSMWRWISL